MHETQRRLNELLRMKYDTFVNSALILQGKADAFTLKSPADRKQVLADLLGLDAYDALEERAREKAKEAESKRREEVTRRGQMEAEVARRPEYEVQAAQVEAELDELAQRLGERDRILGLLREEKHSLEKDAARLQEVHRQLATAEAELAESERQVAAHARRVRECETALAQQAEVAAGYERLVALRARQEELNACFGQLLALDKRRNELARVVEKARSELAAEHRGLLSGAEALEQRAAGAGKWRRELDGAQQELAALGGLEESLEASRAIIQSLAYQSETLRAINERIKQDGKLLRRSWTWSTMATAAARSAPASWAAMGASAWRRSSRPSASSCATTTRYTRNASRRWRRSRAASSRRWPRCSSRHRPSWPWSARWRAWRRRWPMPPRPLARRPRSAGKPPLLGERLTSHDYAAAEQAELRQAEADVAALGYDAREHGAVKAELAKLAVFEERRRRAGRGREHAGPGTPAAGQRRAPARALD